MLSKYSVVDFTGDNPTAVADVFSSFSNHMTMFDSLNMGVIRMFAGFENGARQLHHCV